MYRKATLTTLIFLVSVPASAVLLIVIATLWLNVPFTSGVITHQTLQNGVEVCIVQYFKGLAEPYQVSLYAKSSVGNWRWFYIDHEAERWRNARIDFTEENKALIYNKGKIEATVPVDKNSLAAEEGGYFPSTFSCEEINQAHTRKFYDSRISL